MLAMSELRPQAPTTDLRSLRRRRAVWMGLALLSCGVLTVAALARWVVGTKQGQRWDGMAARGLVTGNTTDALLGAGLQQVSVEAIAAGVLVVLGWSLVRRRLLLGLAAAALVGGANLTTQVLKYQIIERPDFWMGKYNTLPSGHVTVVTSLVVAVLIVAPPTWHKVLVPLASFTATCAGAATLALHWHRPSDIVAAYAVVAAWVGLVAVLLALLPVRRAGEASVGSRGLGLGAAAGAALVCAGMLASGVVHGVSASGLWYGGLGMAAIAVGAAATAWGTARAVSPSFSSEDP